MRSRDLGRNSSASAMRWSIAWVRLERALSRLIVCNAPMTAVLCPSSIQVHVCFGEPFRVGPGPFELFDDAAHFPVRDVLLGRGADSGVVGGVQHLTRRLQLVEFRFVERARSEVHPREQVAVYLPEVRRAERACGRRHEAVRSSS